MSNKTHFSSIQAQIDTHAKALRNLVTKAVANPNSFEGKHRVLLAKKFQGQLNAARARMEKLNLTSN